MLKFLAESAFIPSEQLIYWCTHCDANEVDSCDPTTDSFFQLSGHGFLAQDKEMITLALCTECLKEEA